MTDVVERVEAFALAIPRDAPYLGPLGANEGANQRGYFVREGNRTVYSLQDHSVLVRITTRDGAVGWGECLCPVAPTVVREVITDLAGPFVIGRDPHDAGAIAEDLYDLMRVRGYFGGFYLDALAAIDIALWDLRGKLTGLSVAKLLGSQRTDRVPAYVSGLPKATLSERAALAEEWVQRGFYAVKFASAVARDGDVAEMRAIRESVGDKTRILIDMHWRYTAEEAIAIITRLEEQDLCLAEAPVAPEDLDGLARVAASVKTPIGIGEELRSVYEFQPRFQKRCMNVIQPEMGRLGITRFWQVCQLSRANHARVMPHASIGIGVYLTASLQVSAALQNLVMHEYQHSVFDASLRFIKGNLACREGLYYLPDGPGLGIEPDEAVLAHAL
jgi:L-alanine-DL-glutamate epimerase-like enolase superfamily enzyme